MNKRSCEFVDDHVTGFLLFQALSDDIVRRWKIKFKS